MATQVTVDRFVDGASLIGGATIGKRPAIVCANPDGGIVITRAAVGGAGIGVDVQGIAGGEGMYAIVDGGAFSAAVDAIAEMPLLSALRNAQRAEAMALRNAQSANENVRFYKKMRGDDRWDQAKVEEDIAGGEERVRVNNRKASEAQVDAASARVAIADAPLTLSAVKGGGMAIAAGKKTYKIAPAKNGLLVQAKDLANRLPLTAEGGKAIARADRLPLAPSEAQALIGALGRAEAFAADDSDSRPILNTVNLTGQDGGVKVYAADGFALYAEDVGGVDLPLAAGEGVNVKRGLGKGAQAYANSPVGKQAIGAGAAEFARADRFAAITWGRVWAAQAIIKGNAPDYAQLIPEEGSRPVTALFRLEAGAEIAAAVAKDARVFMYADQDASRLEFISRDKDKVCEREIRLWADVTTEDWTPVDYADGKSELRVAFSGAMLDRVLGGLPPEADLIRMRFGAPSAPVSFGVGDAIDVVAMPMYVMGNDWAEDR